MNRSAIYEQLVDQFAAAVGNLVDSVKSKPRIRINISTTSKGLKSFDCTVELPEGTIEEALALSDELVKELDNRYNQKETVEAR